MGVTFDQIVGPRSTWGTPGSWALHLTHKAYQRYRENEIPNALVRAIKVYVEYNITGNGSGGTGRTGAFGNAYWVRDMSDLKTLVTNIISTNGQNVGVIFTDDTLIPGAKANTDQSVVNWGANVSWGRTGTGTRKPELSGFVSVQPDSVAAGVATFNLGAGVSCYGVRGRTAASTSRDDYYLQPYKYGATAIESAANAYSMFSDGTTGVTTVTYGAHDTTRLELTFNTAAGLNMGDFDGCAVDGLTLSGFGMNNRGSSGGGQCLKFSNTGTNTGVVRDSDGAWGPYHTVAHIVTGTGGIVTWHRCRFGYHQYDSGGTGDGCVNFASSGGHEWGRYGCQTPWGGLDTVAGVALPQTPYAHSNNDTTNPYAYGTEIDCTYSPDYGAFLQSNTIGASVGAIANKDLTTSYRMYTYNRQVASKSMSSGGLWGIHYRANNILSMAGVPSGFYVAFSGTTPLKGLWFSSDLMFICTGTWVGSIRTFQSTSAHDFRWCFSRWRITGVSPNSLVVGGDFAGAGYFKTCSLENFVLSNETSMTAANITLTQANGLDHFWNNNPRVATGGLSGCAYFGMQAVQFNATLGTQALGAAGDWSTASGVPSALQNAAYPLPTGLTCEFDLLGAFRNKANGSRSIGPIEANPVPASAYATSGSGGRGRNFRARMPR